jgi:osmotically-inducible protein OsmY
MDTDADIRTRVIDELDFDPSVTANGIGVTARRGVVTLTGFVPSYFEQETAVRAVQRVKGVKAVAQELKVRLPNFQKHGDDEIAGRALSILGWTMHGDNDIKVVVDDGWVTLSGQVDWGFQKKSAEQAIRKLGGVTGVSNAITMRPHIENTDVREGILRAFRRNAELEGAGIGITVDGATVTLTGAVKTWYERRMAEEAAWRVPGVTEVRDNIAVQ